MTASTARASKLCPTCGRTFAWRKAWARDWENVVYCSGGCRGARDVADEAALEARILALLATRARDATICPSEALPTEQRQDRARMERVRSAARRLVHRGAIVITQRGAVQDPDHARGPLRLRKR